MVLLDLTIFAVQKVGGISVVWAEYLKRLKARSSLPFTLFLPDNDNAIARECDLSAYNIRSIRGRNAITKYLPYLLRGEPGDILHTSYYQWYPLFRGTMIVTLHDFMHELYAPLKSRLPHNALKYLSLKSADVILCISEATKNDLQTFYPDIYRSKPVHVIENAASDKFFPSASGSKNNYMLWVAGRQGYKNFAYALDVLKCLNSGDGKYRLRVVGPSLSDEERRTAESKGVLQWIDVYPDLSTEQLRVMYSDAFALLYLSKYEGFGLPILEAQQCGCPVIALQNPATTEVGQKSLLFMDDNDADGINDIVDELTNAGRRQAIVTAGFANARRYSWDVSVDKLIQVYSDCQAKYQGAS